MSDEIPLSVVGDRLEEMGEAVAALPRLLAFLLERQRLATLNAAAMWAMVKLRDAGELGMADAIHDAMVKLKAREILANQVRHRHQLASSFGVAAGSVEQFRLQVLSSLRGLRGDVLVIDDPTAIGVDLGRPEGDYVSGVTVSGPMTFQRNPWYHGGEGQDEFIMAPEGRYGPEVVAPTFEPPPPDA